MKNAALRIFTLVLLGGCRTPTCNVGCGGNLFIAAVGFSKSDLRNTIRVVHNPNGSQYSQIVDSAYWYYPSATDTSSDTLINDVFSMSSGISGTSVDIIIPATNDTFKITNIALGGDISEQQSCNEGSPTPGFCSGLPYLRSYTINGKQVTVPANGNRGDTTGYFYITR